MEGEQPLEAEKHKCSLVIKIMEGAYVTGVQWELQLVSLKIWVIYVFSSIGTEMTEKLSFSQHSSIILAVVSVKFVNLHTKRMKND